MSKWISSLLLTFILTITLTFFGFAPNTYAKIIDLDDDVTLEEATSRDQSLDIDIDVSSEAIPDAAFDWNSFIRNNKPAGVKFFGLYVGGSSNFGANDKTILFRPASTQKLFTASAYVDKFGWDPKIIKFLKFSQNSVGDGTLAPALGGGDLARGAKAIEDYANAVIEKAMLREGIAATRVDAVEDYFGRSVSINPYQISCYGGYGLRSVGRGKKAYYGYGGSGLDGENARLSLMKQKDVNPDNISTTTAAAMRLFLQELKNKPYFENILHSLPIAGLDGTLEKRMVGGAAQDAALAKTGTLGNVKNIAGYVHVSRNGQSDYVPFVILIKFISGKGVIAFEDLVTNQIATQLKAVRMNTDPSTLVLFPKKIKPKAGKAKPKKRRSR